MFCIVAFIILFIISIFSASHRVLAKEAFDCVFRRVTFRSCTSDFNQRTKAILTGKLINRSPFAAKLLHKHFELLSWMFFILMIASTFFTIKGGINFYLYGSCNGLNKSGFCALDPKGDNNKVSPITNNNGTCSLQAKSEENLTLNGVDLTSFPVKNPGGRNKVIFIGCYGCEYSRKAYLLIQKLISKSDTSFTFVHYPAKENTNFLSEYNYCIYQQDNNKFWEFNNSLFSNNETDLLNQKYIDDLAVKNGYDLKVLNSCLNNPITKDIVKRQSIEITKTNFYGTPTIFINGKAFVGPKPYRVYERILKGWRFW